MAQKVDERILNKMDKTFKILFIIGFIIQIIVAIIVTGNTSTTPLTGWQVASVGIITVLLLVIAAVIYSQFPYSVLGKPKE
jgi:membrane protein YdbS with pleckstrin-like domain